jgi:hypothetical protein
MLDNMFVIQVRKILRQFKRSIKISQVRFNFNLSARFTRLRSSAKTKKILIAPTNAAGQGTNWARALEQIGFEATSLRISNSPGEEIFAADFNISGDFRKSLKKTIEFASEFFFDKSAFLLESFRPILGIGRVGGLSNRDVINDLKLLKRSGIKVGIVFHGSDIRRPNEHMKASNFSPFYLNPEATKILQNQVEKVHSLLSEVRKLRIPIFVSTVDLIEEVPDGKWLPIAIDFSRFARIHNESPIKMKGKPRVLHLPSRAWLKSSDQIEAILSKLNDEGVIEFQNHSKDGPISPDRLFKLLTESDVVVDQFLGVIGVLPIEAVAAGRLVMTHIPDRIAKYPKPDLINVTPETLENRLREVATDRMPYLKSIDRNFEFAKRWHDGRASVEIIRKTLKI